jgi:hypothetical protein
LTIRYNLWQIDICMNVVKKTCRDWRTFLPKGCEEVETPMCAIDALPIHMILAALLWFLAAGALWQGMWRLVKGLYEVDHPASALRVVRGIRGVMSP